jgi:hypothetical protein
LVNTSFEKAVHRVRLEKQEVSIVRRRNVAYDNMDGFFPMTYVPEHVSTKLLIQTGQIDFTLKRKRKENGEVEKH